MIDGRSDVPADRGSVKVGQVRISQLLQVVLLGNEKVLDAVGIIEEVLLAPLGHLVDLVLLHQGEQHQHVRVCKQACLVRLMLVLSNLPKRPPPMTGHLA